ncbi:unnamed protein product [Rotaria sp. Silwood2]|nr:unnamed protein product [Rotaria sp. Silwood2]CAF2608622.1 unnamed protein product [Rotaria sp. Silwood2]CAF2906557.1 unnamed protein product [Rotaria sp. Silwood2]CAF4040513.1 unnamed protein product [Rotaria sp. Silwood2]CAF4070813.1 unnamed protein product [Rotaria sp. Silwood2]
MQLGLIKTAINNIVTELNPSGSSPQFSIYFYGAASTVSIVASVVTTASAVKTKLDQQQYTVTQSNPSTLSLALNTVDSYCQTYCRSAMPRVTVVISSIPDSSAEFTIRQLERNRGMTVIVQAAETFKTRVVADLVRKLDEIKKRFAKHFSITFYGLGKRINESRFILIK